MATLKNIRDRMKVVKSTIKITKVLQTISAAKLRRSRTTMESAMQFLWHARAMLDIAERLTPTNILKALPIYNLVSKHNTQQEHYLYIFFTSDRGLCGVFNNALYNLFNTHVENNIKEGIKITVICIGKKGASILGKQPMEQRPYNKVIICEQKLHDTAANIDEIETLVEQIISIHNQSPINKIGMFYNHFISPALQWPAMSWIQDIIKVDINRDQHYVLDMLSPKELTEYAARNMLNAAIWYALQHSISCEHAMRVKSMDNATQNGQNAIKKLIRDYNKKRQSLITSELIDIISGTEVQNLT